VLHVMRAHNMFPGTPKHLPPANVVDQSWLELQRIISLTEAAHLRGVSVDTIKRQHRDQIIRLSPRRLGMRLQDALMLPAPNAV
jgi:hypothetical protein